MTLAEATFWTKAIQVEICSNSYKTRANLKIHQVTHKDKSFECANCMAIFTQQSALCRHRKICKRRKQRSDLFDCRWIFILMRNRSDLKAIIIFCKIFWKITKCKFVQFTSFFLGVSITQLLSYLFWFKHGTLILLKAKPRANFSYSQVSSWYQLKRNLLHNPSDSFDTVFNWVTMKIKKIHRIWLYEWIFDNFYCLNQKWHNQNTSNEFIIFDLQKKIECKLSAQMRYF